MDINHTQPHHRHSIRLPGYDYSQQGSYFITLCVQNRLPLLEPEPVRALIEEWWVKLTVRFPQVETDAFVVMPNHVHGIVAIVDPKPTIANPGKYEVSIGNLVHWFKVNTTYVYGEAVKKQDWQCYAGRLWQRNYWEHIIRNDADMDRLREYIATNPARWVKDTLHP